MDNIDYNKIARYIFKEMDSVEESEFENALNNNSQYSEIVDGVLNICLNNNLQTPRELLQFLNTQKRDINTEIKNIASPDKISFKSPQIIKIIASTAAVFLLLFFSWQFLTQQSLPNLHDIVQQVHKNEPRPFTSSTIRSIISNDTTALSSKAPTITNYWNKKDYKNSINELERLCNEEVNTDQEFSCLALGYSYYKNTEYEASQRVLEQVIQQYKNSKYDTIERASFYLARAYFELANLNPNQKDFYLSKSLELYTTIKAEGSLLVAKDISIEFLEAIKKQLNQ